MEPIEDGEMLAKGAQLAVACHSALAPSDAGEREDAVSKCHQRGTSLGGGTSFAAVLESIRRRLLSGSDSEAFVALCVCLTILEKALYNIYREGAQGRASQPDEPTDVDRAPVPRGACSGEHRAPGAGGPAMILRDLIATPQVKSALPGAMVAVLRLLLLPLGFNIRNLVVSRRG